MHWPIRNQILVPFAVMQIVTVVVVSALSAWWSVQSAEDRVAARLDEVLATLETSSYPLTPSILQQLRKLSGAHLVVLDNERQAKFSTLDVGPRKFGLEPIPSANAIRLEDLPIVDLENERYFVGSASRQHAVTSERVLVLYPESEWKSTRLQAMFLPLVWGGVVLVLTLLISTWLARRIAGRVQAVERHVTRISQGDYQPVPCGEVDDELRSLSLAVNHMAEVLEQALRQARDSERAATLTQLASGLAHHLRNALTGARVSIQLHQKNCSRPDDQAVQVALAQMKRMEEQIKALLRFAQGNAVPSQSAHLSRVLDDVAALVSPLCQHQQIDFEFHSDGSDCVIDDAEALRGALLNLLTNAIEAAGPSGCVRLEAAQSSGTVTVRVVDDGMGIPDELLPDVFLPFFTTKQEGIGIGLPVARQAAEAYGGALNVFRENGRTVFEMSIRIANLRRENGDEPSRLPDRSSDTLHGKERVSV